uniref:Major facilitator superfamily (MFS) profile domain-containing protein n=1 Tax=Denticeps clupeoides TaxID=299321 RepID=A0AAY4DP44_9TELE
MEVPNSVQEDKQKVIFVTYVIAALEITWLFVQFSITPYLAKRLGFDTLWFGYLQTTVGIIQLLGGPIFGRFADLFGARAALSLSCLASVVYYSLLALANSTTMLFIHKFPVVFMHSLPGTQMVVADLTEPERRADALAKLGLCFGIGMIMGSSLGGTLKKRSIFNLGNIARLMKFPGVMKIFSVKLVSGLPSGIFQVMFSIIAMNFFHLEAAHNGYLMAYIGVVQMFIQGAVIGRLTSRYSEKSLLLLAVAMASFVGLTQAFMASVLQFCIVVIPMMFSLSVFNVITDSMLTKSVPSSDTGTMMGLCASVQSFMRTVGPTIGGFLYENYGVPSFGFIQFMVNAAVFTFLFLGRRAEEHRD